MRNTAAERPVGAGERILALDVLRGFAMLGVLMAYCVWSLGTAPEAQWSATDRALDTVLGFLIDGKFYTILAFLFGYGFSIQLGRASQDAAAVQLYCRRLVALAAIGLAHALLLRNGDILLPYALTGFLLIPFRRTPDRFLIAIAFVALLIPHLVRIGWTASGTAIPERPDLAGQPYLVENAAWVSYWYSTAIFTWPLNLTMFLFGFAAGRHSLISRLADRAALLTGIAAAGLAGGAVLFFAMDHVAEVVPQVLARDLPTLLFTFHCWCMSSAYAALLLLALQRRTGSLVLAPLAAIGRMALTNYLMQAAVIVPICLAFGLFDTFTPTRALLLAAALFVLVQIPFSILWLRHFHFGPAEWFWRLLTYGKLPPLRREREKFAPI
jgi:uncharacterized protein